MQNNPIRFGDPTGHRAINENEGYDANSCPGQDLSCQLSLGGYKKKSKEEIAEDLPIERPVSGIHFGTSTENGTLMNNGSYVQWDFLMDWKNGVYYSTVTAGVYTFTGAPTGREATGYGGWTSIHGIPLYGPEDISSFLAGGNVDLAVSAGADVGVKVSGTKGLSIDVDSSGKPVHTGQGLLGYQYAIENSFELGGNVIPNAIDLGGEFGGSSTAVTKRVELAWWPFR